MLDKFDVKVVVHQGSVLSPLLFIIVLKALLRECRCSLPWEMLYASDLVIIAKSFEKLRARYPAWNNCVESKGVRVNLGETEVMISDINQHLPLENT